MKLMGMLVVSSKLNVRVKPGICTLKIQKRLKASDWFVIVVLIITMKLERDPVTNIWSSQECEHSYEQ